MKRRVKVARENLTMSNNGVFRIISLIVNADELGFIIMGASSDQEAKIWVFEDEEFSNKMKGNLHM